MRQVAPNDIFRDGFDLDTISWITTRLAVTDMYGALSASRDDDVYIINTAEEVTTACDFKMPVEPHKGAEAVRETLDIIADVIHAQIETTENNVVVHCFAGLERSVLACVWYLHKYRGMSIDGAYETIYNERPVVLDRRYWADCESSVFDSSVTYELIP